MMPMSSRCSSVIAAVEVQRVRMIRASENVLSSSLLSSNSLILLVVAGESCKELLQIC